MKTITLAAVRKLVSKWRKTLNIDPFWKVRLHLNADERSTPEDARESIAYVITQPRIWTADIYVNAWNIDDAKELEAAVLHELIHVLLGAEQAIVQEKLGDRAGVDVFESSTDKLTVAFMAASKRGRR